MPLAGRHGDGVLTYYETPFNLFLYWPCYPNPQVRMCSRGGQITGLVKNAVIPA